MNSAFWNSNAQTDVLRMRFSKFLFQSFHPRNEFIIPQKIQWFPGHMQKGMRGIGKVLHRTDCILEVHDARIPFSGRNIGLIKKLSNNKPVILVLNKSDLIPSNLQEQIKSKIITDMRQHGVCLDEIFVINSMSANPKRDGYDAHFLSSIFRSIQKSPSSFGEADLCSVEKSYNLLVIGIPNVGKSTVINRLRNMYLHKAGKATIVGPKAGVTRAVLERIKVCDHPQKLYLFDTPGILEPGFNRFDCKKDQEVFMRCALCGTISEEVVGKELIADYLLYWLNKHSNFAYQEFFGLQHPTDNIIEALTYGAIKFNSFKKFKNLDTGNVEQKPNLEDISDRFIQAFRKGNFGQILLDIDMIF